MLVCLQVSIHLPLAEGRGHTMSPSLSSLGLAAALLYAGVRQLEVSREEDSKGKTGLKWTKLCEKETMSSFAVGAVEQMKPPLCDCSSL